MYPLKNSAPQRRSFPGSTEEDALTAVSVLLAIIPLARNAKGNVLFPARMHMLFRGIKGVYACTNEECPHGHTDGTLTLGEIFLSDSKLVCPHCGASVYELYNDRRCGALFFKGYIISGKDNPLTAVRASSSVEPGKMLFANSARETAEPRHWRIIS